LQLGLAAGDQKEIRWGVRELAIALEKEAMALKKKSYELGD
jgi:hypothetical protein